MAPRVRPPLLRRNSFKRATPPPRAHPSAPKLPPRSHLRHLHLEPLNDQDQSDGKNYQNQRQMQQQQQHDDARTPQRTTLAPNSLAQLWQHPPPRHRLRSTRLRQCHAFQQRNQKQNPDHWRKGEGYHYHENDYQYQRQQRQVDVQPQPGPGPSNRQETCHSTERREHLPRRGNYPGYATYRYRDLMARQQEKWNRYGKAKGKHSASMAHGRKRGSPSEWMDQEGVDEDGSTSGQRGSTAHAGPSQPKSSPKEHRGGGSGRKCTNGRSKASGADLYVARMTRSGMLGNAMPCWRCLEWCKWAGVKRVFHYAIDDEAVEEDGGSASGKGKGKENQRCGKWVCVKVNEVKPEHCYWTQGDERILGGGC